MTSSSTLLVSGSLALNDVAARAFGPDILIRMLKVGVSRPLGDKHAWGMAAWWSLCLVSRGIAAQCARVDVRRYFPFNERIREFLEKKQETVPRGIEMIMPLLYELDCIVSGSAVMQAIVYGTLYDGSSDVDIFVRGVRGGGAWMNELPENQRLFLEAGKSASTAFAFDPHRIFISPTDLDILHRHHFIREVGRCGCSNAMLTRALSLSFTPAAFDLSFEYPEQVFSSSVYNYPGRQGTSLNVIAVDLATTSEGTFEAFLRDYFDITVCAVACKLHLFNERCSVHAAYLDDAVKRQFHVTNAINPLRVTSRVKKYEQRGYAYKYTGLKRRVGGLYTAE